MRPNCTGNGERDAQDGESKRKQLGKMRPNIVRTNT